jgi:hypothetical protein
MTYCQHIHWVFTLLLIVSDYTVAAEETPQNENVLFTADDYTELSSHASPTVSYAVAQVKSGLQLSVRVASFTDSLSAETSIQVGLSAGKKLILSETDAMVKKQERITEYVFRIPNAKPVNGEADWSKLRMGVAICWKGGAFGGDRQRERFLHKGGAAGAGLSENADDWLLLDLKKREYEIAQLKNRIFIDFEQPMDGKASLVIENESGQRIRNLVSGQSYKKGRQHVAWDGLDDTGNVVGPGSYRWRAASHPGIHPEYLFSFYNEGNPPWHNGALSSNWLSDHCAPVAAASCGGRVYLGAPLAESGHPVIQLNLNGEKTNHMDFPIQVGTGTLFLVADDENIYVIMEGLPPFEPHKELSGGKWEFRRPLNILRWDAVTGQMKKYDGVKGEKIITNNTYTGSGSLPQEVDIPPADNLAGAAILNGLIYISLRQENRIAVIDVKSGEIRGEVKLNKPGLIGSDGKDFLVAFSDNVLTQIDSKTLKSATLFVPRLSALPTLGTPQFPSLGNPTGLAVNARHEIFLSDNGTDQDIKVYTEDGKLIREIGKKGGLPINGKWDPNGLYQPHGITIDRDGKLWVTETDFSPKRISVWNSNSGQWLKEFLGPARYGAPGAGFDSQDHACVVAGGCLWKLDFKSKKANIISTLYHQTKAGQVQSEMVGRYWNFHHQNGRTFLIGYGGCQSVYELNPDGSAKLWALCGSLDAIAQEPRWTLPRALAELPKIKELLVQNGANYNPPLELNLNPCGVWNDKISISERLMRYGKGGVIGFMWVDKNGNDLIDADEVSVLDSGDYFQAGYWGAGNPSLNLNIPATIKGRQVILKLQPSGFLPSGAPDYNLVNGVEKSVSVEPGSNGEECVQDRFGREIYNGNPMRCFDSEGHPLWMFPNKWFGVGGSHESPLPESGVMQGVLYFLGTAPLDEKSDVMVMNGNHGRFFVMTTDGFYLDEMFRDVRVTQVPDSYLIGGEPFGGYFSRGEDGKYYLYSGHSDYRIFEVTGLDKIQRSSGGINVSMPQVAAARAQYEKKMTPNTQQCEAIVVEVASASSLPLDSERWPGGWDDIKWGNRDNLFPYAGVKILRDSNNLYLAYNVKDPSPWINNGKDWTLLFKTGDCIDFQFSTNIRNDPKRNEPAEGDRRLLIAPFQGKPIAVLYSYHEVGSTTPVLFSSPWKTVQIDRESRLDSAKIQVTVNQMSYLVTVVVSLKDLGLPESGAGMDLQCDFGVIYGDSSGTMNMLRSYWSNPVTGLVNDVPGESTVTPRLWGNLKFKKAVSP